MNLIKRIRHIRDEVQIIELASLAYATVFFSSSVYLQMLTKLILYLYGMDSKPVLGILCIPLTIVPPAHDAHDYNAIFWTRDTLLQKWICPKSKSHFKTPQYSKDPFYSFLLTLKRWRCNPQNHPIIPLLRGAAQSY